jgi:nucleotide-binding universal stress UspA family protein
MRGGSRREQSRRDALTAAMLVPLDGSTAADAAMSWALALAHDGSRLIVVHVTPEPSLGDILPGAPSSPASDQAEDLLNHAIRRHADSRVQWKTVVALGDPAEQIVRVAAEERVGLIVMTTHGRGSVGRALFGSVADRVARAAPVPVLLVRAASDGRPLGRVAAHRLVVPLDGSALAETALPAACDLAASLRLPIHLVRVVDPALALAPVADGRMLALTLMSEVCERVVAEVMHVAEAYLETVADRLRAEQLSLTWAVRTGSPAAAIEDALGTGDVLVMTSHGHGGFARLMLGSVAEHLVRAAPGPVLLVPVTGRSHAAAPMSDAHAAERDVNT